MISGPIAERIWSRPAYTERLNRADGYIQIATGGDNRVTACAGAVSLTTCMKQEASMADLAGKAALVTGAQQGIGAAIAIALAREGADVAINYLDGLAEAEAVAAAIRATGQRAVLVPGDVSNSATPGRLVDATIAEFGKIDIL